MVKEKIKKYKKPLLLAVIVIPLFLLLLKFFFVKSDKKTSPPQDNTQVTIVPSQTSRNEVSPLSLSIISSSPSNNQVDVPVDTTISFRFNKPVSVNDVPLSILPDIQYNLSTQGDQLILQPLQSLNPGTRYIITLRLKDANGQPALYSYMFTTIGPTPTYLPNTRPNGLPEQSENFQRQNYPDIYLANKTPYSTNSFSIEYSTTETGHYYFIVTLGGTNQDAAKEDFLDWLHSLQLTDQQIQGLDIQYQ